jgi:hypothetical protein
MENESITIYSGDLIWKNTIEYFNENMFIHGFPYHLITKVNDTYYLWELDLDDPDSRKYKIMKQCNDFNVLHDKGMELLRKFSDIYRTLNLSAECGKILIKKIKSSLGNSI